MIFQYVNIIYDIVYDIMCDKYRIFFIRQVALPFLQCTGCLARMSSCSLVIYWKMKTRAIMGHLIRTMMPIGSIVGGAPSQAYPLDLLSNIIKEMQGLSTMSGTDMISAIISDLPVPEDGDVAGMTVDDTVQVCQLILYDVYYIIYYIIYDCACTCWTLACPNPDNNRMFTRSEHILLDYQKLKKNERLSQHERLMLITTYMRG